MSQSARPPWPFSSVVNHSRTADKIAINLNEFYAKAAHHSQRLPEINVLRSLLRNSRRHKFIDANTAVNSYIRAGSPDKPAIVKCWVFKA